MSELHYLDATGAYGSNLHDRLSALPGNHVLAFRGNNEWTVRRFTYASFDAAAKGQITVDAASTGTFPTGGSFDIVDARERADGGYNLLALRGGASSGTVLYTASFDPTTGALTNIVDTGETAESAAFLSDTEILTLWTQAAGTDMRQYWAGTYTIDPTTRAITAGTSKAFSDPYATNSGQTSILHQAGAMGDGYLMLVRTWRQYEVSNYLRADAWVVRADAAAIDVPFVHNLDTTGTAMVADYLHVARLSGNEFVYANRASTVGPTPHQLTKFTWDPDDPAALTIGTPVTVQEDAANWSKIALVPLTKMDAILLGYVDYNYGTRLQLHDGADLSQLAAEDYPIADKPWLDGGVVVNPDGLVYGHAYNGDWTSTAAFIVRPPWTPPVPVLTARPRSQNVRFA